jgi:CTP:molybdopterin cytidylyltransferase MocA
VTASPLILLLAAGRATRMRGADKLMEDVGGTPLLRLMADRAVKAGPTRVVLGAGQDARRALLEGLDLEIVEVAADQGMAASMVAGSAGVKGPLLVALADMPEITANDLYLLIGLNAHAPKAILRAATPEGEAGHPVLFPADLVKELARLTGDTGAKPVLERHAKRVHLVPLKDNRALVDLDTPEDWAAWRRKQ